MIECKRCGHYNPPEAISCIMCNMRLDTSVSDAKSPGPPEFVSPDQALAGSTYRYVPKDDVIAIYRSRGRKFLLIFAVFLLPVLLAAGLWAKVVFSPEAGEDAAAMQTTTLYCLGGFGWLLWAFMLASTGWATGYPFTLSFFLSLFPPTIPLAWARIGGRWIFLPYIYMGIDAVGLLFCFFVLDEKPAFFLGLSLVLLPFAIYQLLGCAVGEITTALGFNGYLGIAWVCLVPISLAGMLANETDLDWVQLITVGDIHELFALVPYYLREVVNVLFTVSTPVFMVIFYLVATFLLWVKSLYENLCYPDD